MAKVYLITESGVQVFGSIKKMQKEAAIQEHELTKVGGDYVVNLTDDSYEIAKDIALLEAVASRKVFSKDKMDLTAWLALASVVISMLVYTKLP